MDWNDWFANALRSETPKHGLGNDRLTPGLSYGSGEFENRIERVSLRAARHTNRGSKCRTAAHHPGSDWRVQWPQHNPMGTHRVTEPTAAAHKRCGAATEYHSHPRDA